VPENQKDDDEKNDKYLLAFEFGKITKSR